MFQQFLQIVRQGTVLNQFEIAEKMGVSPALVLQIARELTKRGYLQGNADSSECQKPGETCGGCPLGGTCQSLFNSWVLTEKGEKAAGLG